ncbi:hypothetical protein CLOSTMETH_00286 [[Clostridium] methylpentosum DSM 5476]|uniref:Uncharacterized protein n=1 Tax=[Clostridium] methylpentosum DSM 5476 TaxID=537013 RepID=C0E8Z1_9FIRM|nr:hypothetical protein CLOSTMETH_00286 [[Clostridium] methylpentosum DSM 5476]
MQKRSFRNPYRGYPPHVRCFCDHGELKRGGISHSAQIFEKYLWKSLNIQKVFRINFTRFESNCF